MGTPPLLLGCTVLALATLSGTGVATAQPSSERLLMVEL